MPHILPPEDQRTGRFVGRVWRPELEGPSLAVLRDGVLYDITTRPAPTMRDLLELDDPVAHVDGVAGEALGTLEEITAGPGRACWRPAICRRSRRRASPSPAPWSSG